MKRINDKLTVLLTCKDREKNLQYCLGSIDGCTPRPTVVLIDFGSEKSIEPYEEKYAWLKVIRVERNIDFFHKSRAYNIGLKQVRTKFSCATDIDQLFHPGFFGEIMSGLALHTKAFVMCKTHFWRTNVPKYLTPENVSRNYNKLKNAIPKDSKLGGEGCCMSFPTKWAIKVNGWDEQYIGFGPEDSDLMIRASLSGLKRVWITGKTSMIHLPHNYDSEYRTKHVKDNRNRFFNKKKAGKRIIVNKREKWGQL